MTRANEVVHTNSQSHGISNHVNPLPSLTTPAQAAINKSATYMLRDGIAHDIQHYLNAGFLPIVEDEVMT